MKNCFNDKYIILGITLSVFFILGVPFIINECYKSNAGYTTMWEASDVLSYYGNILGAIIAVVAISVPIVFTRKQIQYERELRNRREKWERIEAAILVCLDEMNPIHMSEIVTNHISEKNLKNSILSLSIFCILEGENNHAYP